MTQRDAMTALFLLLIIGYVVTHFVSRWRERRARCRRCDPIIAQLERHGCSRMAAAIRLYRDRI